MITSENLEKLHEDRLNNPGCMIKDNIKRMFVDGEFNEDNWNGGDAGLIRHLINDYKDDKNIFKGTNILDDVGNDVADDYIVANVFTAQEETYAVFITGDNEIYFFRYYKDRGKTEVALKDGHNMTEDEYLELLNRFERYGYDFGIYEMKL